MLPCRTIAVSHFPKKAEEPITLFLSMNLPLRPRPPARRASVIAIILLCWFLAPNLSRALAADAPTVPTELYAHGNDEWYWIAKVGPGDSDPATPQTIIQARNNATRHWMPIARMDARVLAIANRGAELAVIQEKNQWSLMWQDRLT